jgi:hypothetical protein
MPGTTGDVHRNAESQDDHLTDLSCVRLLLERGADADAQNDRGTTPLHLAAIVRIVILFRGSVSNLVAPMTMPFLK